MCVFLQTLVSTGTVGRVEVLMGNNPDLAETLEVANQVRKYNINLTSEKIIIFRFLLL